MGIGGDESDDDDRFSQTSGIPKRLVAGNLSINSAIAREHSVVDIVAVVLAAANRQEVLSPKFVSQSKTTNCNVLIGDASLPIGKCARMVISVTSRSLASLLGLDGKEGIGISTPAKKYISNAYNIEKQEFDLGALQSGDVVRFNNIEVHKRHENESVNSPNVINSDVQSGQTPMLNVICDLRASWKVQCAGPLLARICRIIPESLSMTTETQRFTLQWERNIPMSFETSNDVVTELACWYCANARPPHISKHNLSLPTTQTCKRRRIRDINTTNIISHVLVKVLRCERATTLLSTPLKSSTEPRLTHATLSDGHGIDDMIGIAAPVCHEQVPGAQQVLSKGISTTLLQAMIEGSYVLLTNVSTQSVNPVATGKDYLGLYPTMETTASIITPDHPYFVPETCQYGVDQQSSQPLTFERASQLLSLTQQNDSPAKKYTRSLIAIVAPLNDIFVDGFSASLVEASCWEKPRALSNFLIQRPSILTGLDAIKLRPSYRSATLLLDPKIISREIVVNADGDALKLLCMDVPIEDMIIEDECIDASTNPYLLHVGRMLKSLCEEDVRIRWVLEQQDECNFFVINATLLEI